MLKAKIIKSLAIPARNRCVVIGGIAKEMSTSDEVYAAIDAVLEVKKERILKLIELNAPSVIMINEYSLHLDVCKLLNKIYLQKWEAEKALNQLNKE